MLGRLPSGARALADPHDPAREKATKAYKVTHNAQDYAVGSAGGRARAEKVFKGVVASANCMRKAVKQAKGGSGSHLSGLAGVSVTQRASAVVGC